MELRHLRYFVAVAEALSFRSAAARLHVAQPSVGRQVRDLEEEIGYRLFERDRQHVALTDAGRVLLIEARGVIAGADAAIEAARDAGRGVRGMLRIGNIAALTTSFLPKTLAAFRRLYPGVDIELVELGPDEQRVALLADRVQVGFQASLGMPDDARLALRTIVTSDVIVALPPEHPLAAQRTIALSSLAAETLVNYTPRHGSGYERWLRAFCERFGGFTPRFRGRAIDSASAFFGMVAAGEGLAVVPKLGVHEVPMRGGWVTRPLRLPKPAYELCAIWRRDNPSLLVQNYLALLDEPLARRLGKPARTPRAR
jgi:DNA-binding transcriptional LysR family regulator